MTHTPTEDANQTTPLYPTLRRGPQRMSAAEVARHQRGRLEGAMVEAVSRHGYATTTVRELVALAGVSKSNFYRHFSSKEECFLSTFDTLVNRVTERVAAAYCAPGDFREKLARSLEVFMELVVEAPGAAAFVAVHSLTLGSAGYERRERASRSFEALIRQSFEESPSEVEVPAHTVRAIVNGWRGVVYRRLREGREDELPGLVPELLDWGLSHQRRPSAAMRAAARAARRETGVAIVEDAVSWSESPASRLSRAELTQRERIARAAALVVLERGYEGLTIPAISATAGTSHQTFYENFECKRDALLEAFELLRGAAFRHCAAAYAAAENGPEAIGAATRAFCDFVSQNELFAELAFFELPAAGPVALDMVDELLESFLTFLRPARNPAASGGSPTPVTTEAIGTGCWAVTQHEISQGRRAELSALAPALVEISLAPWAGGE